MKCSNACRINNMAKSNAMILADKTVSDPYIFIIKQILVLLGQIQVNKLAVVITISRQ